MPLHGAHTHRDEGNALPVYDITAESASEIRGVQAGRFGWVDLVTGDLRAAQAFYGQLLGWRWDAAAGSGAYALARIDGSVAAGMFQVAGDKAPSPSWTSYVIVRDADVPAAVAPSLGGRTLIAPRDVAGAGRTALLADPSGCTLALWEPGSHAGVEVVDRTGALAWNELVTDDPERARSFHERLFGWERAEGLSDPLDPGAEPPFAEAGVPCAGVVACDGGWPESACQRWLPFFAVGDVGEASREAEELGGRVLRSVRHDFVRRSAILADPHGAVFGVVAAADPARG